MGYKMLFLGNEYGTLKTYRRIEALAVYSHRSYIEGAWRVYDAHHT